MWRGGGGGRECGGGGGRGKWGAPGGITPLRSLVNATLNFNNRRHNLQKREQKRVRGQKESRRDLMHRNRAKADSHCELHRDVSHRLWGTDDDRSRDGRGGGGGRESSQWLLPADWSSLLPWRQCRRCNEGLH